MGSYQKVINKGLLPFKGKAVISHIIDRFPEGSEFVIALGYRAEQVRQYLEIAHPNARFLWVYVDRLEGPGSGPGYSLKCCKEFLQKPFFYVSCDTMWHPMTHQSTDVATDVDWLGVSPLHAEDAERFCNVKIADGKVIEILDKLPVQGPEFARFTGLGHIVHFKDFFASLDSAGPGTGEARDTQGLRLLVKHHPTEARWVEWTDIGTYDDYRKAVFANEKYDFSKADEFLFTVNNSVIKLFSDPSIAVKRMERARKNPAVFPAGIRQNAGFLNYPFVPGKTLYEVMTPELFSRFLAWLTQNLWKKVAVEPGKMPMLCHQFYFEKTLSRLAEYNRKYPAKDEPSLINGEKIESAADLLANLDWKSLNEGQPVFIHGDLHFDNSIYDEKRDRFTLLDWRHDFAGDTEFGDLYYDLAKLNGGMIVDYQGIKANRFFYKESAGEAVFSLPTTGPWEKERRLLREFVESNHLSMLKVDTLTALIFLNMSPLHHYPFDRLLHSLGRHLLRRPNAY